MGRIVACSHCGAPHRTVRGQTRSTCEWCGGENTVDTTTGPEELVVEGEIDPARVARRAEAVLVRRGVRRPHVVVGAPRWIAQWQVVGEDGDSLVRSGTASPGRLEAALDLPTAAFRVVTPDEQPPRGLPAIGPPEVDVDEILSAARATFGDPDQPIAILRLLWQPVCDVRAHTPGGVVDGIYRGGADEVVFAPLPSGATAPPLDPAGIATFASFAAAALLVGIAVDDAVLRAIVLGLGVAGILVARPLFSSRRPRSAS